MVDYGSHTSDNLTVLVCKVEFSLTEFESAVLVLVEGVQVIERH